MASRVIASFDCETVSEANQRQPWQVRAKRARGQRQTTAAQLAASGFDPEAIAASKPTITLVRVGKRALDTDNLAGALKAVRDAIAKWLGVDDGPKGPITWAYAQETHKAPLCRVRIEVGA